MSERTAIPRWREAATKTSFINSTTRSSLSQSTVTPSSKPSESTLESSTTTRTSATTQTAIPKDNRVELSSNTAISDPDTGISERTEQSANTGMSDRAKTSVYTGRSQRTEQSAATGKSQRTGPSAYTGISERIGSSAHTGKSERTEQSVNTGMSARVKTSAYMGMSERTGPSAHTGVSSKNRSELKAQTGRSESGGQTGTSDISELSEHTGRPEQSAQMGTSRWRSQQMTATERDLSSVTVERSSIYSSTNTLQTQASSGGTTTFDYTQYATPVGSMASVNSTYLKDHDRTTVEPGTAIQGTRQPTSSLYFVRTAERMDKMFVDWLEQNFEEKNYSVTDLNQALRLIKRSGGPQDYGNDPPITEMGHVSAQLLGRRWRQEGVRFSRVFVSPALRCVQTAAQICSAAQLNLAICIEPGLFESLSQYQSSGMPHFMSPEELFRNGYNISTHYEPFLDCERLGELLPYETGPQHSYARLTEVIQNVQLGHQQPVLIVAHGITIDACGRMLCGKEPGAGVRPNDLYRLGLHYPYCSALALEQQTDHHWKLIHGAVTPLTYLDTTTAIDTNYFNRP